MLRLLHQTRLVGCRIDESSGNSRSNALFARDLFRESISTGYRGAVSIYQSTWQDVVVAFDLARRLSRQGNQVEGQPMKSTLSRDIQTRGLVLISLVVLLLIGLPLAVWLDLSNLDGSEPAAPGRRLEFRDQQRARLLRQQCRRPGAGLARQDAGHPQLPELPGAIPIPATLSLELGKVISEQQQNITYRFVSDYPFQPRAARAR